jgi:hypothetical protein
VQYALGVEILLDALALQLQLLGIMVRFLLLSSRFLARESFREYLAQPLYCLFANLVMHNESASANLDSILVCKLDEVVQVDIVGLQVEPHHVGVDGILQLASQIRPDALYFLGVLMRLRKLATKERLLDCNTGRRSYDAGLSQPTADGLADPAAALDEGFGADDDAPYGCAEALAETEAYAVELGAEVLEGAGTGSHGLPQAGAVQVHDDAVLTRPCRDATRLDERHDGAVERVLERDDARGAGVHVVGDDGVLLDFLEGEVGAVLGVDGLHHGLAEARDAAGLVVCDVAASVAENGLWRGQQVRAQGDLVAHGARQHEQRVLLAGQVGDEALQRQRGGVLHGHVVEQRALLDRLQHRRRGRRVHVGAEVKRRGVLAGAPGVAVAVAVAGAGGRAMGAVGGALAARGRVGGKLGHGEACGRCVEASRGRGDGAGVVVRGAACCWRVARSMGARSGSAVRRTAEACERRQSRRRHGSGVAGHRKGARPGA